jgi:hypothetical protein
MRQYQCFYPYKKKMTFYSLQNDGFGFPTVTVSCCNRSGLSDQQLTIEIALSLILLYLI